jgi:hypothetical protein
MKKSRGRQARTLALLSGASLLLLGLLFVLYYGRVQTVTCTRSEPSQIACTQQISWFKLIPLGATQILEPVQAATTEEHCSTDRETNTTECRNNGVKLITPTGGLSLSPDFFNTETAQATADRLNQFIQDSSEETLAFDNINGIMAILGLGFVSLIFLASGVLVLIVWR